MRDPGTMRAKAEGTLALQNLVETIAPLHTPLGRCLFELLANGSLQPVSVAELQQSRITLEDLVKAAQKAAEKGKNLPKAGRIQTRAIAYLLTKASVLEGLIASPELDRAMGISVLRELVGELIPVPKGPDPAAAKRLALSEVLAYGELSEDAFAQLKGSDRRQLADLIKKERSLLVELAPEPNRETLERVLSEAVTALGSPNPLPLDDMNARLMAARTGR